jgi:NAD(P)-dependent dehydrogenase (short-subunit alcohol dehydrogenase family)
MKDLRGKVAIVTGGAGGIGQAMGRRFGQQGMKVVLADVVAEPLDEATRALAGEGIEVAGVVTDVTATQTFRPEIPAPQRKIFASLGIPEPGH